MEALDIELVLLNIFRFLDNESLKLTKLVNRKFFYVINLCSKSLFEFEWKVVNNKFRNLLTENPKFVQGVGISITPFSFCSHKGIQFSIVKCKKQFLFGMESFYPTRVKLWKSFNISLKTIINLKCFNFKIFGEFTIDGRSRFFLIFSHWKIGVFVIDYTDELLPKYYPSKDYIHFDSFQSFPWVWIRSVQKKDTFLKPNYLPFFENLSNVPKFVTLDDKMCFHQIDNDSELHFAANHSINNNNH